MKSPFRFFNHFPRRRGLRRLYPAWFAVLVILGCIITECLATEVTVYNGSGTLMQVGIRRSTSYSWGNPDLLFDVAPQGSAVLTVADVIAVGNTGNTGVWGWDYGSNATATQRMSIVFADEAPAGWMNRAVTVTEPPSSGPTLAQGLEVFMKGFIFGIVVQLTGYVLSRFWKIPEDAV